VAALLLRLPSSAALLRTPDSFDATPNGPNSLTTRITRWQDTHYKTNIYRAKWLSSMRSKRTIRNLSLYAELTGHGGIYAFLNLRGQMKKRQLFLKWCTNMLTLTIIFLATGLGATQTSDLSLVGTVMVLAIGRIYFITPITGE